MSAVLPVPSIGVCVTLAGVRRAFANGVVAVDDMDLAIAPGEFVAILGPSGCGKSTLLRLIASLDHPDAGRVMLSHAGSSTAYVFQDAHLLPWRTVLANVALPLELMGVDRRKRTRAAEEALAQVGLSDSLTRYPAQLSGGMRMRVSLARAGHQSPAPASGRTVRRPG